MQTSSARGRRRLQFERLESREVMTAGITTSFAGGVLTVTGTAGADTINFYQRDNWIGIMGVYNAWDAGQVTSIAVNLSGGDDAVSLDSVGKGWGAMAEPFAITSTGGAKTVRLPSGQDATFSGAGRTLAVAANGNATLDGTPLNYTPPAAITATFAGGVLTINGTAGNDSITAYQRSGWIGVYGVYNAWDAAQVTSIVINSNGGTDAVSIDSVGKGWDAMAEDCTINSGSGATRVRLANGRDVDLNGAGHTLRAFPNGSAQLDGVALNFAPQVITITFNNGVLNIAGTAGNDTIKVYQRDGWIGVMGVWNAWSAAQVNSIVIDSNGGNDVISIDSVGMGWQAMSEAVTIKSGAGNSTATLAGALNVALNGTGHTLTVAANGAAHLDGVAVNPTPPSPSPAPSSWFDLNIVDAALRSLANARYGDGSLSRNDILDLLSDAKDGDAIDATELSDLRKIVANTTLFAGLEHVWKLASYVVTASAANTNYQGQALGNLAAGSTGAHLDKLVNKWFLGLDRPTTGYVYRQFSGQLFVNGATYDDVRQGAAGDCYFVASLAVVALKNPAAITNMFIVNGDGTYTVRFYNGSVTTYVTVDSYLPTNSSGAAMYTARGLSNTNAGGELWTAIAEKAYAQLNEFGWSRSGQGGSGLNTYAALDGGYINAALRHITGQSTVNYSYTGAAGSFTNFVNVFNQNKMIAFASFAGPGSSAVVGSHAYAVVGYNAATQQVTLFNPWGISYGLLTLSWSEIQTNFMYFDRTA